MSAPLVPTRPCLALSMRPTAPARLLPRRRRLQQTCSQNLFTAGAPGIPQCRGLSSCPRLLSSSPAKVSDPLRILFCGSDEFSVVSLRALHQLHRQMPGVVEAIQVLTQPGRRTGRGLRTIAESPCQIYASKEKLPHHERTTFTGWNLPEGINLVVAVSFGLFVPPRILRSAKYGGLNVHPSQLPHLRGPAPIHHAILRGESHIGVTLQTLDDKAFDHGTIIAQTPAPGLSILPGESPRQLIPRAAANGARMLAHALLDGLHVPPIVSAARPPPPSPADGRSGDAAARKQLVHAPKLTKADARVRWTEWTGNEFRRRMQTFETVWALAFEPPARAGFAAPRFKRLIFTAVRLRDAAPVMRDSDALQNGFVTFYTLEPATGSRDPAEVAVPAVLGRAGEESCHLQLVDGSWVEVRAMKIEGKNEQPGAIALRPFFKAAGAGAARRSEFKQGS